MHIITLSDNLKIDIGSVMEKRGGQRFAFIGKSGSGKTNSLLITAQQWLENGWPMTVIDPMNNFRALRTAGLPVIIAGKRESANVIITPANAAHLAHESFTKCFSVVLDVSMHEEEEQMATLQAYLKALWTLVLTQDEDGAFQPYGIFIDEAHLFVPQNGKTDVSSQLIDISKRGRQLNVSMFFTTQRPAAIQKDYLTQSNLLVSHRVTFGDVKVVADAISQPPKMVSEIMKKLKAGEAIVAGDADLVDTSDHDYIQTRIHEWDFSAQGRQLSTNAGLKAIDGSLLQKLHDDMATAEEDDTPGRDWESSYRKLETENGKLAEELAQAKARIAELESIKKVEEKPAQNVILSDHWDGKSALAIKRAINFQQRQFNTLLRDIQTMPKQHRVILTYLTQRENSDFPEQELARRIGYSWSTLASRRPIEMERLGLIHRELSGNRKHWVYRSVARNKIASLFPDLDTDTLIEKICRLEAL